MIDLNRMFYDLSIISNEPLCEEILHQAIVDSLTKMRNVVELYSVKEHLASLLVFSAFSNLENLIDFYQISNMPEEDCYGEETTENTTD